MFDIDRSLNTSQLIFKTANVRLTMTSSVRSRYNVRIAFKWKFIFFCLLSVHHTRTSEFQLFCIIQCSTDGAQNALYMPN